MAIEFSGANSLLLLNRPSWIVLRPTWTSTAPTGFSSPWICLSILPGGTDMQVAWSCCLFSLLIGSSSGFFLCTRVLVQHISGLTLPITSSESPEFWICLSTLPCMSSVLEPRCLSISVSLFASSPGSLVCVKVAYLYDVRLGFSSVRYDQKKSR